jgi:hypothetical protein
MTEAAEDGTMSGQGRLPRFTRFRRPHGRRLASVSAWNTPDELALKTVFIETYLSIDLVYRSRHNPSRRPRLPAGPSAFQPLSARRSSTGFTASISEMSAPHLAARADAEPEWERERERERDAARREPAELTAAIAEPWWMAHRPHKDRVGKQGGFAVFVGFSYGMRRSRGPQPRAGCPGWAVLRPGVFALFLVSVAIAPETRNKASGQRRAAARGGTPGRRITPGKRVIRAAGRRGPGPATRP